MKGQINSHGRYTPKETAPYTQWVGGQMGRRFSLGVVDKKKMSSPCQALNPNFSTVHSIASLYTD
jgi:hypothetical protein